MRSRTTWVPLAGAALIFAAYAVAELAGLRETTSLLTPIALGLFLATYLLAVLVAPVLLIAALLRELFARMATRNARPERRPKSQDA
jgi:cellobiose-specific phosphotransferase system component IIC